MNKNLNYIRKITPRPVLSAYHWLLAYTAMIFYGNPSRRMIVICVTGTNGKSTTVNLIGRVLEAAGDKTGFTTTANFKIGDAEWINDTKMTMLGRFQLQKTLKKMADSGCKYAIIETSSQGISQFRHLGINYDYAVFTNLTPEHIEAHGDFDKYKEAKGRLFSRLGSLPKKRINGKQVPKTMIINLDDEHADYFLQFSADRKIGVTQKDKHDSQCDLIYTVSDPILGASETRFDFEGSNFSTKFIGVFNLYNLSSALAVAFEEKIPLDKLHKMVSEIPGVPGRMEIIDEGQPFTVLVDYAPEPYALRSLYDSLRLFSYGKLIHVLGSCGGGRDVARRPVLGKMAGEMADYVIVTNEDPYDDDPMEIIFSVAQGAEEVGKKRDENLFIVPDRREAIAKAIELAGPSDLVLLTGKGCEVYIMAEQGRRIPHDDREVAREVLRNEFMK